jgi:hypothetical protein
VKFLLNFQVFACSHLSKGLGPVLGATLAAAVYKLLKALEYETGNPGQDVEAAGEKRAVVNPDAVSAAVLNPNLNYNPQESAISGGNGQSRGYTNGFTSEANYAR